MTDFHNVNLPDKSGVAMVLIKGIPNGSTSQLTFVDATPEALSLIGLSREALLKSTDIGTDVLYDTLDASGNRSRGVDLVQTVMDTSVPFSRVGYYRLTHNDNNWHKDVLTITKVHHEHTLLIQHEITHTDPRLYWVNRIDPSPNVNRLILDNGSYITWEQYQTLHRLMRGESYKEIARHMSISPKTVNYRLDRIKAAFEVDTLSELMEEVFTNGLVHLVTMPLQAQAECESQEELLTLLQQHHPEMARTGGTS